MEVPAAVKHHNHKMSESPLVDPTPPATILLHRFFGVIEGTAPLLKSNPLHPDTKRALDALSEQLLDHLLVSLLLPHV